MGGAGCKEEVKEETSRSVGREDSLTSADRIRRFTVRQFGYNVLSLARRGLKVQLFICREMCQHVVMIVSFSL